MKRKLQFMQQKAEMKKEDGMLVVEAVISFMIFMIVCLTIANLINIFVVHNRIQFAINSTAKQLAGYTYFYQALGLREAEQQLQEDGDEYVEPINDTVDQVADSVTSIQKAFQDIGDVASSFQEFEVSQEQIQVIEEQINNLETDSGEAIDSIEASIGSLKELFSDPNSLAVGIIYMGVSGASYLTKSVVASAAAGALCKNYLSNGSTDADTYLKSYGIVEGYSGLDFSGSTMLCDGNMRVIDIVVEYDIDLSFAKLIIPDAKIHVVNRVSVPAWLDGDGQKAGN